MPAFCLAAGEGGLAGWQAGTPLTSEDLGALGISADLAVH